MEEEVNKQKNREVMESTKLVKKVRKSRKIRKGRRKQNVFRKTFRFFMTLLLFSGLIYISKMPQWYLPKDAYSKINPNVIIIKNNKIVKPTRIYAVLKTQKVPKKPIYMMKTSQIQKDLKKLKPVKDVYVRRYAFPARLVIILEERNPIISVAINENTPVIGAFADDGVLIGQDFMPLPSDIKTIKVLVQTVGNNSYTKWSVSDIDEIQKIALYISMFAKEPIEYIDMRNPNNIFVKIQSVKIKIGKPDGSLYERIERISSILPQIKYMKNKIEYIDVSWEKVNYLKLKNN